MRRKYDMGGRTVGADRFEATEVTHMQSEDVGLLPPRQTALEQYGFSQRVR